MNDPALKQQICDALRQLHTAPPSEAGLRFWETLGYRTEKRLNFTFDSPDEFRSTFEQARPLNDRHALLAEWKQIDGLFQLTENEITSGRQEHFDFGGENKWNNTIIESYLFFALTLKRSSYTRTQLAGITREINRLFPMPVMLLFFHGQTLTLGMINRRLHKRDESKDVLEKVTLIKDIDLAAPHRAHLDILGDLSLDALYRKYAFKNFVQLHEAWQKTLDSSELNKRFYRDIANWYFWASKQVVFPKPKAVSDEQAYRAQSLIRLLTRLIFCWFLKEKGLIPDELFNWDKIRPYLTWNDPTHSTYYKAVLQNLFFATLNTEMNGTGQHSTRRFSSKSYTHHMVHTAYRYESLVKDPEAFLTLFKDIPFLNGGLFECLDSRDEQGETRIDGFSDHAKNPLTLPDFLFFGEEHITDLSKDYGERKYSRVTVRPLIEILRKYKFTITENTPIEQEIALDPELLGLVFENLLAAYNPETDMTARKVTGSFYTPREVVDFMMEESLIAYFQARLNERVPAKHDKAASGTDEDRLRHLFAYTDDPHRFTEDEVACLIEAIDQVKILDPACGSGAFPMGALHKMVYILRKLDPDNAAWKARQIAKAREIPDAGIRERALAAIEEAFARNEDDYGRKLYLIENCLYGVDIQPIAAQIAKLRFFISLIVEQTVNDRLPNRGILALPNLETNFVAANTLLGLRRSGQTTLSSPEIDRKKRELQQVRHDHFTARSYKRKKELRQKDKMLRDAIAKLLRESAVFPDEEAARLAQWDPYNPNVSADFFDAEWMFGIQEGFDLVIGNPPYVRQEEIKALKPHLQDQYHCYTGVADLYVYFYERAFDLLKVGGLLCFISSNKYFRSGYGERLRHFLATNGEILELIDFGDAPIFTSIAYPSIILIRKIRETRSKNQLAKLAKGSVPVEKPDEHQVQVLSWEPGPEIAEFPTIFKKKSFSLPQSKLTRDGWRLESPVILRLLDKVRGAGTPLGEYVNGRFYRGILTGLNEAFVVDRATRDRLIAEHPSSAEILKPFLRGKDVKRWRVEPQDLWLIFTRRGIDITKYPAIHQHLKQFKARLMPGVPGGRKPGNYQWYEIQDNIAYWQEFERPKIFVPAIEQGVSYAPDYEGYFGNDKTSICVTDQVPFLLGLLNSQVLWWFLRKMAATKQGGFYEFKPMYVTQLPIPDVKKSSRTTLIGLAEEVLTSKKQNSEAFVADLEAQIDGLVAHLYGLTEEEFSTILKDLSVPDPAPILNAYRDAAKALQP